MIGICPHCKINLKKSNSGNRETNEMLVVMNYRKIIDSNIELKPVKELGYCEVCNATIEDLKEQDILI